MPVTIYPDAATSALLGSPANQPVDTAKMTQPAPLAAISGNVFGTILCIQISMSLPSSLTPPQVTLRARNPGAGTKGTPVVITAISQPGQALLDGTNSTEAAAAWLDGTNGFTNVFQVKVFIAIDGTMIDIQINSAGHNFVWTVADSDANAQQPWIQLTPFAPFSALVNDAASVTAQPININNRGTGPLTVSNITPALAAPYALNPGGVPNAGLPAIVNPNPTTPAAVLIGFTAPAATGSTAVSNYTVDGDAGAVAVPASGHNNSFSLSATTSQLEVVMVLDDSGSMGANDTTSTATRLSELTSSAKQFLNYLAAFGANSGTVGVVTFPGDPNNPGDLTSYDLQPAETIPADMTALNNKVGALVPVDSTPMDFGIQEVFSRVAPRYFANDATSIANDRRWMLLMSDGAWNVGADPNTEIGTLQSQKVIVFSAGYGQSGQVDYATLQALAGANLGGQAFQVDLGAGLSAKQLAQKFKAAIVSGLTINTASDPDGVISVGQEARYPITITPYDNKAVFSLNWDTPSDGLSLQLMTPNCELITPQSATNTAGIGFSTDVRFRMFTIAPSYLHNDANPSQPRHGTWQMIVSYPQILGARKPQAATGEHYSYDVLTDSALKLDVALDRSVYYAGDSIGITARLSLNGLPITGASVRLSVTAPGQSMDNWLAGISITDQEYQAAAQQLAGKDAWGVYIKAFAAQLKGLVFDGSPRNTDIVMADPSQIGIYSATVNQTTIPDGHTLYITAIGTTKDGVSFRRERSLQVYVGVRPDAFSTIFNIVYDPAQTNPNLISGTVSVTPSDRFGNVVLTDPARGTSIALTAQGATLDPKLSTKFNGTYSSRITYLPGATPVLTLSLGGVSIVSGQAVPPADKLIWVNQVVAFAAGIQAAPGANQHTDANAALGSVLTKPAGTFVSLGAYGVLSVAVKGELIKAQGDDDVTVFVQPDTDLRAYLVEALPKDDDDGWVVLGTSSGATASFSLSKANLSSAKAIRITDKSGRTRDSNFKPIATPGVSVRGVGVKGLGEGEGGSKGGDGDICIRIRAFNPQRQPLGGIVDIEFKPQDAGQTTEARGVDASKDIDVKGLKRFPQVAVYQVTVTPTDVFKPTSQFVTIPASGFNTVEFVINKKG
jgi:hypothetical protein